MTQMSLYIRAIRVIRGKNTGFVVGMKSKLP